MRSSVTAFSSSSLLARSARPSGAASLSVSSRVAAPRAVSLPLTRTDMVVVVSSMWGLFYVAWVARWVPGWWLSCGIFALLAAGPLVFRWAALASPRMRWCDLAASFWLMPAVVLGHQSLGPIVDSVHPLLVDGVLARADLKLFGGLPAAHLSHWVGPVVTEICLLCYYGYFVWPLLLGVLLYRQGKKTEYQHYTLALALTFLGTFLGYVMMPAVGPRFLWSQANGPLSGIFFTPWLESAMRSPEFNRDCFPSGHTAVTLVMLTFAYRFHRRFFLWVLPAGLGLIAATLVGKFHYGVDLLAALPLAAAATWLAGAWMRGRSVLLPRPRYAVWNPRQIG